MKLATILIGFGVPLLSISAGLAAESPTNQSKVGQGQCSSGKNYWYQAKRFKDGTLCTTFSFSKIDSFPIDWDPKWNSEAKKNYCKDSEKDACFSPG
jgi:hypothetical protein